MSATWQIILGGCRKAMAAMPEASIDAIVTDPPYGLEFMAKSWDRLAGDWRTDQGRGEHAATSGRPSGKRGFDGHPPTPRYHAGLRAQEWHEAWATEALRVLKPGGHMLVFGGTRTYHRLTCGIEDAGFEVRDCLAWLYGSGFPKSLDVSKAIDRAAGAEREVLAPSPYAARRTAGDFGVINDDAWQPSEHGITAPATPDAERWQGWGTALKPAHEPIVVARKPLAGTVAGNVLAHGTGAVNVDGCRIAGDVPKPGNINPTNASGSNGIYGRDERLTRQAEWEPSVAGRWPANVVLDEEAAAMLDEQGGERPGAVSNGKSGVQGAAFGKFEAMPQVLSYGDTGGASRFFYVAKADSAERNAGLSVASLFSPDDAPERNDHPTVKPIDLMRWLVRLVTPPGGTVLDPFTGSGTTGCAAMLEGFGFVGIEREASYAAIARARLTHWSSGAREMAA